MVLSAILCASGLLACGHDAPRDEQTPEIADQGGPRTVIAARLLDQLDDATIRLGPIPPDDGSPSTRVVVERRPGQPLGEPWVALESTDRPPRVAPQGEQLVLEESACTIVNAGPSQGLVTTVEMAPDRAHEGAPPGQQRLVGQPIMVELDQAPPSTEAGCQIPFLVGHGLMPHTAQEPGATEQGGLSHYEVAFTTMSQTRAVAVVLATELHMSFYLGTHVSQQAGSTARLGSLRVVRQGVEGITRARFRQQHPPDPLLHDDRRELRVKPSLGRRLNDAFLAPPGTSACWTVDLHRPSTLRFSLGVAWHLSVEHGRPVRFAVTSGDRVLFEESRGPSQQGWVERSLPLTGLEGEQELCLETSAPEGPGVIWSLWGTPEIEAEADTEAERPQTVVLVSIDTLRADRLGCYGYSAPTSPVLDRLAEDSMVYEEHVAQTGWTLPSHVSMLTGLAPEAHGVTGQMDRILDLIDVGFDPDVPTLAAAFRAAGYSTHGIVSAPYLDPAFGFDRGFDSYDASVASSHLESHRAITAPAITNLARQLIDRAGPRPLFLFIHFWDAHYDYLPPREDLAAVHPQRAAQNIDYDQTRHPFTRHVDPALLRLVLTAGAGHPAPDEFYRRILQMLPGYPRVRGFIDVLSDLYDGEIHSIDRHLGMIFETLRQRRRGDALIVVTGDHGESFMEHGTLAHGVDNIHREGLVVPLIIHAPGRLEPGRHATPSATADISATLLDLVGLEPLRNAQGHSLIRPRGDPPPLVVGHDGTFDRVQATQGNLRLVVWGYFGHDELFDLSEDHDELVDVGDRLQEQRRAIRRSVALYLLEHARGVHVAVTGGDHAEEVEVRLEANVPLRPAFAYGPPSTGAVAYGTLEGADAAAEPSQQVITLRASPGPDEVVALAVLAPNGADLRVNVQRGGSPAPADVVLGPDGTPLSSNVANDSWDAPLDALPDAVSERSNAVVIWRTQAYSVRTPLAPAQETLEQLRALGYIR